jgi:hypothetical protein
LIILTRFCDSVSLTFPLDISAAEATIAVGSLAPERQEIESHMTLIPFPPTALDELALRLLDVAATVRKMANSARDNAVQDFQLHGNKAHEWLDHLEQWTYEGAGRLDAQIMRERGARRGLMAASSPPKSSNPVRTKTRK